MIAARSIRVRGVVQGVGFRPFILRLARSNDLAGWVRNGEEGVEIHLEGAEPALDAFVHELEAKPPAAASIAGIDVRGAEPAGLQEFAIRESRRLDHLSARISPDLAVCPECLRELFDSSDPRFEYPYINCTHCGPRYSILLALPYDRANTTMFDWPMDELCERQYLDTADRRFHAQPVSCAACGPRYFFVRDGQASIADQPGILEAASLLREGGILAVKGIGGYHLACDAKNAGSVAALRNRKYRKEKPFALMVRTVAHARDLVELSHEAEKLLMSSARPIVVAPAKSELPGVAPDNPELGVMLAYTPLHELLFAAGAPETLVMTSANRSSEPIAYRDNEARQNLSGIADAFLIGERPIARRVEDSVTRAGAFGPMILRRSRGYAPGAASRLPVKRPIVAVGADLKNTVTLSIDGQAFVSQHIGDLDQYECFEAFRQTILDLTTMYEVPPDQLLIAYDCHPQYRSVQHALALPAAGRLAIQHHRAHIASVLAEREAWDDVVLGVSFDGTGYGDDGSIWGGEIFAGSVTTGFERVAHLRQASLPGGDAAAHNPVQAAAGFLPQIPDLPDCCAAPFHFPVLYETALRLARSGVRTFPASSMGRLFDAAAALLGFTRRVSFEGQAAIWLESLARTATAADAYPFPFDGKELDFRPLLAAVVENRRLRRTPAAIARAFQRGIAQGLIQAVKILAELHKTRTVVLSGGVFQNELLLEDIRTLTERSYFSIWTNHVVPPNDGGVSLGQAALAAFGQGSGHA